jgi:hypothetical protein
VYAGSPVHAACGHARVEWDRFQLLTTVGFTAYNNSREIVARFYRDEPYKNLDQKLYDNLLIQAGPPSKKDALLYLRCNAPTEASMRIARRVSSGPIRSIIDDPQEVRLQTFAWYVQQVSSAFAIVCHLLSTEWAGWEQNNAKHALVAGLAHGAGKPLLMLAHEPYTSPLDYRDLLRTHHTAAAAESIFADWSLPLIAKYEKRITEATAYRVDERAQTKLRDITIGEPVAEFESDLVPDYFVSTAAYSETLRSKYSIVVGRKGTGKTATLYALTEELTADPRNHVCVIKPVGYELDGLTTSSHGQTKGIWWKASGNSSYTRSLPKAYTTNFSENQTIVVFVLATTLGLLEVASLASQRSQIGWQDSEHQYLDPQTFTLNCYGCVARE